MKQKVKSKMHRPRNPLARHPLMAKGGVHRKTEKARRAAAKRALKREAMTEKFGEIGKQTLPTAVSMRRA